MKFVYFGTPKFSVTILDELKKKNFLPSLIVTSEDKPSGRKLILTPSPTKAWALENNISFITPKKLRDDSVLFELKNLEPDLFIVAAYGKIIPQNILDIPKKGTLNVHPSRLPLLRGPSPIESAITSGLTETTVSIMELDALMDHGPIIAQSENVQKWTRDNPPKGSTLEEALAIEGGKLLSDIIPKWINGELKGKEQNHDLATFCVKTSKEDGLVDIEGDPTLAIQKIRAYDVWPGAFYFHIKGDQKLRVKITEAKVEDGKLVLQKVIPEGKKEMNYQDFLRGIKK